MLLPPRPVQTSLVVTTVLVTLYAGLVKGVLSIATTGISTVPSAALDGTVKVFV